MDQEEDIQLIQALRIDRRAALKALHERFYDVLWLYAQQLVKDKEIGADIAQDTFVNFYNNGARFKDLSDVRGYLFKTARNLAFRHLRREKLKIGSYKELGGNTLPEDITTRLIDAEMLRFVVLEIKGLPPQYRSVVELILNEGLKPAQISERLGINPNLVRQIIWRAIERIRIQLLKKRILDNLLVFTVVAGLSVIFAVVGYLFQ